MPTLTFWGPDMVQKVRDALPRTNPYVQRQVVTYPGVGDRHTDTMNVQLKGVATGNGGLIFTFSDGVRHILESGDNITITQKRISFTSKQGAKVTLILK